jgi:hypothetical protein
MAVHQSNGTSVTLDAEWLLHVFTLCKYLNLSGFFVPEKALNAERRFCKFEVKIMMRSRAIPNGVVGV